MMRILYTVLCLLHETLPQPGLEVIWNPLSEKLQLNRSIYRVAQKTGPAYLITNIPKTP